MQLPSPPSFYSSLSCYKPSHSPLFHYLFSSSSLAPPPALCRFRQLRSSHDKQPLKCSNDTSSLPPPPPPLSLPLPPSPPLLSLPPSLPPSPSPSSLLSLPLLPSFMLLVLDPSSVLKQFTQDEDDQEERPAEEFVMPLSIM